MSKRSKAVERLNQLHAEYEQAINASDTARAGQLLNEIVQAQDDLYKEANAGKLETEGWMLIASVLLILLGALFAGWEGVGFTFCPLAVFWIVGYGIIWKIILDK